MLAILGPVAKAITEQEGGTHADETSIMLVLARARVDTTKAQKDYVRGVKRTLTHVGRPDAREPRKGRRVIRALLNAVVDEVDALTAS